MHLSTDRAASATASKKAVQSLEKTMKGKLFRG